MILTALATKAELAALVESFTPLRVTIDERRGRALTLARPHLELVPGRGLRLRGAARISWDVAGVAIPVTIQGWQLLLAPKIVPREGARVLLFEPVVERLDVRLLPGFIDDKIARAIRESIAKNRERIAWKFTRTLSKRWPLSVRVAPITAFELVAVDGEVAVTERELRMSVRFEARVHREERTKAEAQPPPRATELGRE